MIKKNKALVNKVIKGLKKASKTHASQAKTLQSLKLKKGGKPGQWSARKAQMMAKAYKKAGGGYK